MEAPKSNINWSHFILPATSTRAQLLYTTCCGRWQSPLTKSVGGVESYLVSVKRGRPSIKTCLIHVCTLFPAWIIKQSTATIWFRFAERALIIIVLVCKIHSQNSGISQSSEFNIVYHIILEIEVTLFRGARYLIHILFDQLNKGGTLSWARNCPLSIR